MNKQEQLIDLRKRKLGLLIFDARTAAHRSIEDCAWAMAVSVDQFKAFETGKEAPSLPALESLSFFLDVPLAHFWGSQSISDKSEGLKSEKIERMRKIRDRIIGAQLRQERDRANLTLKQISDTTGIPEDILKRYELGQESVHLPELEMIAQSIGIPLESLFDTHGPVGEWRLQREAVNNFGDLPPKIRQFVIKPVNRPYLELAMRLSDLSVEKLRAIAEGLLEITY